MSIVCIDYFVFSHMVVYLMIGVILLGFCWFTSNHKLLHCSIFIVAIFSFIATYVLSHNSFPHNFELTGIGKIVVVKPSYYLLKYHHSTFYLPNNDYHFVLGERVQINGVITQLTRNANDYEFDFTQYLNHEFVFYEIKLMHYTVVKTNSLIYWFNHNLDQSHISSLTRLLWLNQRVESNEIYDALLTHHLTYITNACMLLVIPVLYYIQKLKYQQSKYLYLQIVIIGFIGLVAYLQMGQLLLTRLFIFWSLKLYFKHHSAKLLNFEAMLLLIVLHPTYIYSLGFWYLNAIFIFASFLNYTRQTPKKLHFIAYYCLFISLHIYFNYQINLTNSFYTFVLIPIINVFGGFSLFCDLVGLNLSGQLHQTLLSVVRFFNQISLVYNVGAIPLWAAIIFFVTLLIIFNNKIYGTKLKITVICGLILTMLIVFLLRPTHTITMLNVGNANAFVYHNKWKNLTIIFDAGTGLQKSTNLVSDYLQYCGINKIDAIFISHMDSDHYNNFYALQEQFKIKQLITNTNFVSQYQIKNVTLQLFQNPFAQNDNDASLVIFLDVGNFRALFMGDAEISTEHHLMNRTDFIYYLNLKPVNLMQVGHHGSKTSSSLDFLSFVHPQTAFISGTHEGGNKNFPHQETLDTLNRLQIPYYITNGIYNWTFNLNSCNVTTK